MELKSITCVECGRRASLTEDVTFEMRGGIWFCRECILQTALYGCQTITIESDLPNPPCKHCGCPRMEHTLRIDGDEAIVSCKRCECEYEFGD